MPGIFISYRRDDSAGYAGRLYDDLCDRFGSEALFRDLDSLEPGADFVEAIEEALSNCDAIVVVIGQHWLISVDAMGQRRLQDPSDFVRLEVEAALKRGIRVLPVLVQGAKMPSLQDLPGTLAPLARRQACELSDSRWKYDVGQLIQVLEESLKSRPAKNKRPRTPETQAQKKGFFTPWCTGLGLLGVGIAALNTYVQGDSVPSPTLAFILVLIFPGLPLMAVGKVIDYLLKGYRSLAK
jgi:hypothetical protein